MGRKNGGIHQPHIGEHAPSSGGATTGRDIPGERDKVRMEYGGLGMKIERDNKLNNSL